MGIESPVHLLFIAVVALVVLGPKRLPALARALGQGIREFRESLDLGTSGGESRMPPAASAVSAPTASSTTPSPAPPAHASDATARDAKVRDATVGDATVGDATASNADAPTTSIGAEAAHGATSPPPGGAAGEQ
jgi:TatA/E family protein of Tat protein translocase